MKKEENRRQALHAPTALAARGARGYLAHGSDA